jgi:sigma-B regulation protein RsbU (phosphoserine phosphatase)
MDFRNPFRLDFIRKASYGSLFQVLLALAMLIDCQKTEVKDSWIVGSLLWTFSTQAIRVLVYLLNRKSEEKLLSVYWIFAAFSYASATGWGMVACASLIRYGISGIGISALMICTAVACATAYAASAILSIQRIYTVIILLLPSIGLVMHSPSHPDWMMFTLLGVVALYCLYLAQKQHGMTRILYEQRERIKKDLEAARIIQQSLLPELSQQVGNFKIEVLYRPCEDLSGDFFEIQTLQENILFYVADVTSHGTAAAQVTYLLKGLFKSVLPLAGESIDLKELTRKLAFGYSGYGLNYSVGLFMGSLNIKTGILEFVSSNFPQPVLIESDQASTIQSGANPIIDAMFKEETYDFVLDRLQIQPGASLFVFTDGAFELKSKAADKDLNQRQLRKILLQGAQTNWEERILSQLQSINQTVHFPDDITIMKIQHGN